jgi:hypothetical protein
MRKMKTHIESSGLLGCDVLSLTIDPASQHHIPGDTTARTPNVARMILFKFVVLLVCIY